MDVKAIIIRKGLFKTSTTFNIAAIGICGILALFIISSGNYYKNHNFSIKHYGRRINAKQSL